MEDNENVVTEVTENVDELATEELVEATTGITNIFKEETLKWLEYLNNKKERRISVFLFYLLFKYYLINI